MAFTSTITGRAVIGNKVAKWGTFTNTSSSTGGDINTGLHLAESVTLTPKGTAVAANAPAVNEDLPVAGNAVTIVTDADQAGYWQAIGDFD
ncbi:MAG: hypothetical protein LLG93_12310 [Deltaproteobacteria bacterium]|nr:hypothetical protein [Deltaproteobacteria bacterium]